MSSTIKQRQPVDKANNYTKSKGNKRHKKKKKSQKELSKPM